MRLANTICLLLFAAVIAVSTTCGSTLTSAASSSAGTCFGTLVVTPKRVHIGQTIRVQGTHFSCLSPENKLFPTYSLFLYQYGKTGGFHIYTIHVDKNGASSAVVKIPRHLNADSTVLTGKRIFIRTRPGTYYLSIRLFDVALDPPRQALATITVLT